VQQPGEFFALGVIHRVAAELVPADQGEDFLERGMGVDADHVLTRVGPVHDFQLAHFHGRGEYAHALVARVLTAAGVQDQLEFFAAVVVFVVRAWLTLAGDAQDSVGAGVEQVDGRVHGPVEQVQRHGGPQRQQLGLADRPRLGRQFADHDVQVRNDEEGDKERHRLDHFSAVHAQVSQQRFEQVGERWFTDPAQAQRGEGDAQLAGRKVGVELVVYLAQDAAAPAMQFGNGLDAGGAQLDHGELGGNEETVEQHQQEGKDDHAEIGE